mmetsp:Transcript_17007/g.37140  ORF Transcript_17007/g.37140 Transcript_17007/m.37140 type:complete len:203 (+) Transcript_17007:236-844(+)
MTAMPCPPPMHAAPTPYFLPVRLRLCVRWVRMRAPDAPRGCPRAMAPPLTLTFSRSRPNSRSQEMYWAAKASLISIRSMSARVRPAALRALRMASTGPMPIMVGSQPTRAQEITCARGFSPSDLHASSEATTRLAAPSQMPLADPAVTAPPSLNTVFSFVRSSIFAFMRGCSSALIVTGPFLPFTSIGAISSSYTPASDAFW